MVGVWVQILGGSNDSWLLRRHLAAAIRRQLKFLRHIVAERAAYPAPKEAAEVNQVVDVMNLIGAVRARVDGRPWLYGDAADPQRPTAEWEHFPIELSTDPAKATSIRESLTPESTSESPDSAWMRMTDASKALGRTVARVIQLVDEGLLRDNGKRFRKRRVSAAMVGQLAAQAPYRRVVTGEGVVEGEEDRAAVEQRIADEEAKKKAARKLSDL